VAVATATTILTADDRKLRRGLTRGLSSLRRFGQRARVILKSVAIGIAGIGVAAVASAFLFLKAFEKQEKAERKLQSVIKATGMAAGFTADQLKQMASALQIITTIGDEVILNAQAILLTFKEIKGDEFKDATVAMLDMATVLDTDLKSAAILVGKALNDPIRGATALTRSGVTFTEQQKEQIKVMQEAGDILGAQRIILGELESQFKGAAEAVGDTFGGRVRELIGRLGDLSEKIAGPLVTVVDAFIDRISVLVTFLEENIVTIEAWIDTAFDMQEGIIRLRIAVKDLALGFTLLGIAILASLRVSPFGLLIFGVKTLREDLKNLREDFKLTIGEFEDPLKVLKLPKRKTPEERAAERAERRAKATEEFRSIRATLVGGRAGVGGDRDLQSKQKASFESLEGMAKRIQIAAAGGDPQTKAANKTATATEKIAEEVTKGTEIAKEQIKVLRAIFGQQALTNEKLPQPALLG